MIVAWPLLLGVAAVVMWRHRHEVGGRGTSWFLGWLAAGLATSLSLAAGFSIGLYLLPAAGVLLLWVARRSPHVREATGFFAGAAATVLLLVVLAA